MLSVISGMLGLGVAFAAIPFLGLFYADLVNQVQPLSLLLNGVTAAFSTTGFAKSKLVNWKHAIPLGITTTLFAPLGAYLAHFIPQIYIWLVYFASVAYLAYRLFKPVAASEGEPNLKMAIFLAMPISVLSGFLGVGPGFLLMPTLILLKYEPKKAAGINAFAVTPPSFSALLPHLHKAQFKFEETIILVALGAIGAFVGARITSRWVPNVRLKQIFGILIIVITLYKIVTMVK